MTEVTTSMFLRASSPLSVVGLVGMDYGMLISRDWRRNKKWYTTIKAQIKSDFRMYMCIRGIVAVKLSDNMDAMKQCVGAMEKCWVIIYTQVV